MAKGQFIKSAYPLAQAKTENQRSDSSDGKQSLYTACSSIESHIPFLCLFLLATKLQEDKSDFALGTSSVIKSKISSIVLRFSKLLPSGVRISLKEKEIVIGYAFNSLEWAKNRTETKYQCYRQTEVMSFLRDD